MWVELSNLWIFVLNVVYVPAIHLGVSWAFTRMESSRFNPEAPLFRDRSRERGGEFYQSVFRIRSWKKYLPDAATWFDGFAKRSLSQKTPEYLRAFLVETCRGEAAHHFQVLGILLTLLWNPWPWAAGFMIVYALGSNFPCLILLRFTRARLRLLLGRLEMANGPGESETHGA